MNGLITLCYLVALGATIAAILLIKAKIADERMTRRPAAKPAAPVEVEKAGRLRANEREWNTN